MNEKQKSFKSTSNSSRTNNKRSRNKSDKTRRTNSSSAYNYSTSNHNTAAVHPMDKSGMNDFSWYNRYPELIASSARLAFPFRPGMQINEGVGTSVGNTRTDAVYTVPGALIVNWIPSVGKSQTVTDPASLAAKELYTKVRAAFSGTLQVDAPDFLIQMVAMDSIFAYLAHLKRIYRIVNTTNPNNYLMPYGYMRALGFSVEQTNYILENRSQFLFNVNTLIRLTDQLRVPAKFDFVTRHYWMSDNVYMDAETYNAQAILFKPLGFYQFSLTTDTQGIEVGSAVYTPLNPSSVATDDILAYLYNYGLQLINSLTSWDDCYTINGYLERAFEGAPLFGVDVLLETEQLAVRYSPEVLSQIENSSALCLPSQFVGEQRFTATITQDPRTNAVVSNPTITVPNLSEREYATWHEGGIISLRSANPTPEEIIIATRLRTVGVPSVTDTSVSFSIYSGTEVVFSYGILTSTDTDPSSYTILYFGSNLSFGSDAATTRHNAQIARYLSNIDWAPLMPIAYSSESIVEDTDIFGDIHNLAFLDMPTFQALNRICLLSEFAAFSE